MGTLLRALLLLMEQLDYNLRFQRLTLTWTSRCGTQTVFSKNRERLLEGAIASGFFQANLDQAGTTGLPVG